MKRKNRSKKTELIFEELEPRLLLSADPLAVATDVGADSVHELVLSDNEHEQFLQQTTDQLEQQQHQDKRSELVIIDSRAPNFQQLHNDVIKGQQQGRNVHVVILDAHRDGIEQINEALASFNKLDAVHIVSHGDDGQLQLGATKLNQTTLRDRTSEISAWKDAFGDDGDLLIYGCNLAETEDGKSLVDALSHLTATDVAASDDLTGNRLLGGDWELEYEAGDIETEIAFSDQVQDDWQGTLDAAAQAAAEEQQAAEQQRQQEQEQQAQAELEQQQAAVNEEEQAALKQEEQDQRDVIADEQRHEIVFIDESVNEFQSFIDDLRANSDASTNFEIVSLDKDSNGVERIGEILDAYNDVDAVHILSHGDDGCVKLGSTWLDADNLDQYRDSLGSWGKALDVNADLLIYGCNLAESAQGENFINQLAQLTGADVAASNDLTGHTKLGGDWDLEYEAGDIETSVAISEQSQQSWENVLGTPVANDDTAITNEDTAVLIDVLANDIDPENDTLTLLGFERIVASYDAGTSGSAIDPASVAGGSWFFEDTEDANAATGNLQSSGVSPDGASGQNAWNLVDGSNTFGENLWYSTTLSPADAALADTNGWSLSAEIRLVDDYDEMRTTFIRYGDGTTRFLAYFDLDSNNDLTVELIDDGGNQLITLTSDGSGIADYHHYEIVYDPGTSTAMFLFDGVRVDGGWSGEASINEGVRWGMGSGGGQASANYHSIEMKVFDQSITTANGATVTNNGDGTVNFAPTTNYTGADNFTYTMRDSEGHIQSANVDVNVVGVADGIRVTPLSLVPIGGETLVNTTTTDNQFISSGVSQAIATDANGNYIVVWQSNLQDGSGNGIYAQLFNADGSAQGGEFLVNTTTADNQSTASVAMDDAGNFVVTWQSNLQDGDGYGIYAQRFNAAGVAQDSEFLVNTFTIGYQGSAGIAMAANGDFVIQWASSTQDPDGSYGIYAQRYNAAGVAQGGEFRVNTYTDNYQQVSSISMDDAGNFVVTWGSYGQDGSNYGVFGQVFNADGTPRGSEFQVNTTTANSQLYNDVVMLEDGRFVVAYQSSNADTSVELFIQAFNADGSKHGTEIHVNTVSEMDYFPIPSITADASGNFTVVWNNSNDGTLSGVFMRSYDWDGNALTGEVQVNTTAAGEQLYPEIVAQPGGGFIVAWSGNGPSDTDGVFMQRYGLATTENGESARFQIVLESAPTADVTIPISITDATEGTLSLGSVTFTASDWNVPQTVKVTGIEDLINDGDQRYQVVFGAASSADPNFDGLILDSLTITNVDTPNQAPSSTADTYTVDEDGTLTVDWWDSDWTRRQQLSFDNLAQTETLTDMPVLIVLNSSNIDYSQTNDDGSDLRFFAADGTPLAYEIEQWNESGDSTVWVKVPQITGNSNTDSITMYYGNAAVTSAESPSDVWDSNFVGVWHLNQEQGGSGDYGVYEDSTANNNDGKDNVVATGQEGSIADGQEFDANDWIEIAHDPSLDLTDSMTISFWIKPTSDSGTFNRVVEKGLWGYQDSYYFGGGNGTNDLTFYLNGQDVIETPDNILTVGVWQHAAVSYTSNGDGTGTARMYLDGVEIASGNYTSGAVAGNNERLGIGHHDSDYDFDGYIDEVQISNTDRSADWIAAQYQAMNNALGDEFVSFGGEEVAAATAGVLTNDIDLDGDMLAVNTTPVVDVSNGTLLLKADGTFTYTPDANFNGTDSFTYEVSDGNGGTAQATVTITVNSINDEPQGTDNTVVTTEDTDYVFTVADFGLTDASDSPADDLLNVMIATAPANGTLYLDANGDGIIDGGETLGASTVVSAADISAGRLKFKPAANANGSGYDAFTFQVQDDGGTAGGGIDTDAIVKTITIDVTAVNDTPVAAANMVTTTEDNAYSFSAADFTFSDVEGNALVSATITNLNLAGGTLTHSGGTTVNNGDTLSAAQLDTLVYTPAANANGSPLATFDFTVNDSGAGVTAAQMSIDVTAVNDVPVATANTVTTTEDNAYTFSAADFTYTDTEGDLLVSTTITNLNLAGGTLTHSGGTTVNTGDTLTAAQLDTLVYTPAANANGASLATFDFTVNDAGSGVVAAQMGINVTAVNDVPVATTNTVSTTEDNAYTFSAADFSFTDVEGDALVSATINNLSLAGGTLTHSGGTVVNNGDTLTAAELDTLVYTPPADTTGSPLASFDFSVNDTGAGVVTEQMSINVTAVNDVPVATANTVVTTEDNAYTFSAADFTYTDTESDALVSATMNNLSLAGGTLTHSGGTMVNAGDMLTAAQLDTLVYTPAANANGAPLATFDFTVNDSGAGVTAVQMSINVTAVNDAPVASANTVTTTEDNTHNFTASDFTFFDVEGDSLVSATITNLSLAGGTLTHSGGTTVNDGDTLIAAQLDTLVYTPASDANGAPLATFDYTVNDGDVGVFAAQMSIDVTPVNDVPVATANTVTTTEDNAYTFSAADFTFTDVEGDSLLSATITNLNLAGGTLTHSGGTTVNNGDTLTAAQLDTLVYTPAANANGSPLASFDFTVNDAGAGVTAAQMSIDVTAVNNVPVATANTVTTTEDNAYTFSAADFTFTDVEGDSLVSATITNLNLAGGTLTHSGGTTVNSGDTLTVAQLDTLLYTPAANANGSPLATFDFTVNDSGSGVTAAQMSINVTAVNDVPVATANTVATTEDNAYTFSASDFTFTDVEGDALVSATITNLALGGGTLIHSGGTVVNNGDTLTAGQLDTLVYTPPANTTGAPLAAFDFTVNDAGSGAVSAQMSINVTAVNDVPVATANTVTTSEDNVYSFSTADFTYTDTEGDALVSATIINLNLTGGTLTHSGGTVVNNGDTLTAAQLDTLVYTPVANANGTPLATFDFSVNDAGTGVVTAQMAIDVTAQPDTAVIGGVDSGMVTEDVDPDMDNLLEVSGALTIIDPDAGEAVFNAGVIGGSYGVLTLNVDGSWDYAANNSQLAIQGLAAGATLTDTFAVSSADGTGHTVTITIMGTNDAPVAGNDVASVNEGGSVVIAVAATDSDIDSMIDLNSIVITSLPSNGSVVVNGDGTVAYTHNGNEALTDSFSYTIADISGAVSTAATVSIAVTPMNDAPAAGNDVINVAEGNTTMVDLAANDSDVDNALDLNSITIISAPANGMLLVNGDGTVTYSHNGSNTSGDSFSYTIADITGAISNTATVTINVTAVNDAPTTTGIADVSVNEDAPATHIDLNAAFDDSDNPDAELHYSIVGNTDIGLFSAAGINGNGQLTLAYAANMNGATQITVRATDPSGQSVDTLFTVNVTPVNDDPVLQANSGMMAADGTATTIGNDALNATDIDNPNTEVIYTLTALPANGTLMLNGVAMTVNETFTQADLDNNRLVYQASGTAATDQFGFTVSDSAGGQLGNRAFNIAVQLRPVSEESKTTTTETPVSVTEETEIDPQETILETGNGGLTEGAGGYGGAFDPFGSSAVPPPPKPTSVLSLEPAATTELSAPKQITSLEEIDIVGEVEDYELSTFAGVQVQSMEALWTSVDKMKQEMAESAAQMDLGELKVAAAKSSGIVLTAGIVAWAMRGGALLSSLMSTIPLWKGYDPLPVLAYKDDDEDEGKAKAKEKVIDEHMIPTSLDELKKLKEIQSKKAKQIDVDTLFSGSAIRD